MSEVRVIAEDDALKTRMASSLRHVKICLVTLEEVISRAVYCYLHSHISILKEDKKNKKGWF